MPQVPPGSRRDSSVTDEPIVTDEPKRKRRRRPPSPDAQYGDEIALERRTGISRKTWQSRRARGLPPAYIKLGNTPKAAVIYNIAEVEAWLRSCERRSTSDPGPAAVEARSR